MFYPALGSTLPSVPSICPARRAKDRQDPTLTLGPPGARMCRIHAKIAEYEELITYRLLWRARDDARKCGNANRVLVVLAVELGGCLRVLPHQLSISEHDRPRKSTYRLQLHGIIGGRLNQEIVQVLHESGL